MQSSRISLFYRILLGAFASRSHYCFPREIYIFRTHLPTQVLNAEFILITVVVCALEMLRASNFSLKTKPNCWNIGNVLNCNKNIKCIYNVGKLRPFGVIIGTYVAETAGDHYHPPPSSVRRGKIGISNSKPPPFWFYFCTVASFCLFCFHFRFPIGKTESLVTSSHWFCFQTKNIHLLVYVAEIYSVKVINRYHIYLKLYEGAFAHF